jgi:uncharacterized membrane protein YfhO
MVLLPSASIHWLLIINWVFGYVMAILFVLVVLEMIKGDL